VRQAQAELDLIAAPGKTYTRTTIRGKASTASAAQHVVADVRRRDLLTNLDRCRLLLMITCDQRSRTVIDSRGSQRREIALGARRWREPGQNRATVMTESLVLTADRGC